MIVIRIRDLVSAVYTILVTYAIGKWAFHYAYLERGYKAVGGEYILLLMTCWLAWKTINYLFDTMEELENERKRRSRKKVRGRGAARMRNYR